MTAAYLAMYFLYQIKINYPNRYVWLPEYASDYFIGVGDWWHCVALPRVYSVAVKPVITYIYKLQLVIHFLTLSTNDTPSHSSTKLVYTIFTTVW